MRWQPVVDYLVYVAVRLLICLAQAIRMETGQRVAATLAWLFADVLRIRDEVVQENLRHAFPEMSQAQRQRLIRAMWQHLFLLVLEVAHAPRKIHETNWRRFVRLRDIAPLVEKLLGTRPTLIVTAHYGNFEVGGYMLGVLGFPTYAIARPLDNPYLNRFLNRFRGATGQYIIPKNGGYDQVLAVMAHSGILSLLADQYAGRKGCWVKFFDRPASAHKAIALLALENNAPVMVVYSRRLSRPMQFELCCTAMVDPNEPDFELRSISGLTQWYTAHIEDFVRQCPDQYWWIHRRWKDTRSQRASKLKRAA